jgi:hypothetical protein
LKKIEVGHFRKCIGLFEQFSEDNDKQKKCHQFDGKLLFETISRPETLHIRANSINIEVVSYSHFLQFIQQFTTRMSLTNDRDTSYINLFPAQLACLGKFFTRGDQGGSDTAQ